MNTNKEVEWRRFIVLKKVEQINDHLFTDTYKAMASENVASGSGRQLDQSSRFWTQNMFVDTVGFVRVGNSAEKVFVIFLTGSCTNTPKHANVKP